MANNSEKPERLSWHEGLSLAADFLEKPVPRGSMTVLTAFLTLALPALVCWGLKRPDSASLAAFLVDNPEDLLGTFHGLFLVDCLLFWLTFSYLNRLLKSNGVQDLKAKVIFAGQLLEQTMSAAVILGLTGTAFSIFRGFSQFVDGEEKMESAQTAIKMIFSGGIAVALATTVVGVFLSLLMDMAKIVLLEKKISSNVGLASAMD